MRLLVLLLGIALVLTAAVPSAGASAESALAALRTGAACAPREHAAALTIRGRHAGSGLGGTFVQSLDLRDGRWATHEHDGPFTSAAGYDGSAAWVQDFTGGSHALTAPTARAVARTRAWIATRGWCERGSPTTYRLIAANRSGTPRAHVILRATPQHGAPVTLFVDPIAHRVDRTVLQLDENREVADYSDWRTVDGAPMALQTKLSAPGDVESETRTILSVQSRTAFPRATFARPRVPDDVSMTAHARLVRVPYVLDGEKPLVNVTIDGKGPFPFVIDTGGHFILTAATARTIGVTPHGAASSVNAGAVTTVGFARIRQLRIGGAVVRDQVAEINPYGFTKLERGPRAPKAGWLGLELLERFAMTIDPVTRTMTLQPLSSPRVAPPGVKTPLVFTEDAPLVACTVAGKNGLCMIDTGNAGATIVLGGWAARNGLAARFERGLAVRTGARVARATIAFGGTTRRSELLSYQLPGTPGAERSTVEAAIMSEHLIDGFVATFDYARGAVWLAPVREYRPAVFNRSGVLAEKRPNGTFIIRSLIARSPAASAGMRRGDIIERLDGRTAREFSGADFSRANGAAAGSRHTYSVARGDRPLTVTLRFRDLLPAGP